MTLDPAGPIRLDSTSTEAFFAWIANTLEGTVSKLDTRTGAEVARYPSVTSATAHGGGLVALLHLQVRRRLQQRARRYA